MDFKELTILLSLVPYVICNQHKLVDLTKKNFDQNVEAEKPQLLMFYHQGYVNDWV